MSCKCYSELVKLKTFQERYRYLRLVGKVGEETFGFDRYLNQELYRNPIWTATVRRNVIIRDEGCDLGDPTRPITGRIIVHHMNPITLEDIRSGDPKVFDPEFLICCSHDTHNAIHYGDSNLLQREPIERKPGDTLPWLRSSIP